MLTTVRTMQERVINILLVEDDEVDVMNVQRAFKRNNIENPLYIASNGLEALKVLRNQGSEIIPTTRRLVLLDLNMPRMGGIEFLHALRNDTELRMTPVIVLTTSNQDRDRVEAYNLNVAGYILKPVTFAKFSDTMAALNKYWSLCEMPFE
jgi:CheY-like chemotaxis protein